MSPIRVCAAGLVVLFVVRAAPAQAEVPSVLTKGDRPDDIRLEPPKDLDGYFPFEPSASVREWEDRASRLRVAMQVALGLWPMPTKMPVNAVVHGRMDMGDYTIEKVYLESLPGFYVTGNLYRPDGAGDADSDRRRPAVLCPHGHFADGRFGEMQLDQVRREIVQGAERFENGGRNSIQARCVQLARMGCVVFQYDMIGYCDSVQISYQLAHRFAKQRPDMIGTGRWGFFSPQAESHSQSIMGLQTYNSIRALDWVSGLPDVDPDRIAVTGASGGGTQTFILCAIDPRPAVAVPAVMVSTAMQGGCTCENASLLRVGTGNVEFAALFAPKPLCLLSADDWTREMATKGFPELRDHYGLYDATDRVLHRPLLHFGHNYNYVSRAVMYSWLNRHLQLGLKEPIVERDYERLTAKQLSVWDEDHPRPQGGVGFERQLLRWWADDATAQLANLQPHNAESAQAYRNIVGGAIQAIIGRDLPGGSDLEFDEYRKASQDGHLLFTGLLRNRRHDECLPVLMLMPDDWKQGKVAIWLHESGKGGLYEADSLRGEVRSLLGKGVAVVGVDLLFQGEFASGESPPKQTRRVENPRESAAYTLGYNHSLFVQRVHDVLNVVGFAATHDRQPSEIWLIGLDGMGPLAAAARAVAGNAVHLAVVDTQGFRFADVNSIRDPNLLPGGAKYHDLPGILSLSAPHDLWVVGEDEIGVSITLQAYAAVGAEERLRLLGGERKLTAAELIKRLIEK